MEPEPNGTTPTPNRRGLIYFAGAATLAVVTPNLIGRVRRPPELAPHPAQEGFRLAEEGAFTARLDPFAGLEADGPAGIVPTAPTDLCAALFDDGVEDGAVPVAFFTDIACPHCRAMEPILSDLPSDRVRVTWHDLPLLGAPSLVAARAIAAARRQEAEAAFRTRLTRTRFQPDDAYVAALADGLGLDPLRFAADMAAPATEARIARTLGAARALGVAATPALVVGDIVAIGRRERAAIEALLDAARPPPC